MNILYGLYGYRSMITKHSVARLLAHFSVFESSLSNGFMSVRVYQTLKHCIHFIIQSGRNNCQIPVDFCRSRFSGFARRPCDSAGPLCVNTPPPPTEPTQWPH